MPRLCLALAVLSITAGLPAAARADDFKLDNVHSSFTFKIEHSGVSFVHGRFNEAAGDFTFDQKDPTKAKFVMTIKVASVDTAVKPRDEHLRKADFFDVEKFPEAKFTSTAVKVVDGGWQVTGDFLMHGVTKPVTFVLKGGKISEGKGGARIGFWTEFTLKRTDFGMNTMVGLVGDDVFMAISFEGTKK